MEVFLHNIFTFPTVFYSGLLVLVALYWLVAIVGLVDIDSGDADLDADTDTGVLGAWLSKFKLEGIPLTIVLSFITLASWVLCFLAVYFIYPLLPETWVKIMVGFWLLVITPVIAALIVSPLLQPVKPLFKRQRVTSNTDLVGQYAVVRSGKVSATFGEAEFQDGGAGLIVKIRADEPNQISRGDQVALLSYDATDSTYHVRGNQ